jgi:hypothetical protein
MRTITVGWRTSGEDYEVVAEMAPAEHDVGIMSPYPTGWKITNSKGEEVEFAELPPELEEILCDAYYEQEL